MLLMGKVLPVTLLFKVKTSISGGGDNRSPVENEPSFCGERIFRRICPFSASRNRGLRTLLCSKQLVMTSGVGTRFCISSTEPKMARFKAVVAPPAKTTFSLFLRPKREAIFSLARKISSALFLPASWLLLPGFPKGEKMARQVFSRTQRGFG